MKHFGRTVELLLRQQVFALGCIVLFIFAIPNLAEAQEFGDVTPETCKECHTEQWQKWRMSDHFKAMQVATDSTVSGLFNGKDILINDTAIKFFRKQKEFWVEIENSNGELSTYQILYSFGHFPLQQYLVKTTKGRFQVLPYVWDNRKKENGGQNWIHIYGKENIAPNDRLHWSSPLQNWNGMCADCHSTGLVRNYDVQKDVFDTHWKDINVSCESCHGSYTQHAKQQKVGNSVGNRSVWQIVRDEISKANKQKNQKGGWVRAAHEKSPHWEGGAQNTGQIETCAACHARRSPLSDGISADENFLNQFTPTFITPPAYYVDGQIRDEVYVYGSFLQSKMYQKGVICSDCHNAHTQKLKFEGNQTCTQCHSPEILDTPEHHQHKMDTNAAQCVSCHMPQTTYMQVDARRDHSFKLPRPDLTQKLGTPNACQSCHTEKSAEWATQAIMDWPQYNSTKSIHYGEIFQSVFDGKPEALTTLRPLLMDENIPEIIRATGYIYLSSFAPNEVEADLRRGALSKFALIRIAATRSASILPQESRVKILGPLLTDTYKSVRVEVARSLSANHSNMLASKWNKEYESAYSELITVTKLSSWRGEGRINLGILRAAENSIKSAQRHYNAAMAIDPFFAPSYVNLADLLREQNDETASMATLKHGLSKAPKDSSLNYAMGLAMIRSGNKDGALVYLEQAANTATNNVLPIYVYGVALNELGYPIKALRVLEKGHKIAPEHTNILQLLITLHLNQGETSEALGYVNKLLKFYPDNNSLIKLKRKLAND